MPSPVGHALAGMAAGWLVDPPGRRAGAGAFGRATIFALAGMAPDLDLLFGAHRGATHGLSAALVAGALAWACSVGLGASRSRAVDARKAAAANTFAAGTFALAVAAAYASHTLLDWLGSDTSPPIGIMALWPVSREYSESPLHLFMAISRRYWLPDFWAYNLRALLRELAILLPVLAAVMLLRRRAGPA
jgi:membrane-bound metal-dependent hydrolase YbcI (DUF457 family)